VRDWLRASSVKPNKAVGELLLRVPEDIRQLVRAVDNADARFAAERWRERIPRQYVKEVCESLQTKADKRFQAMLREHKQLFEYVQSGLVARRKREFK